MELDLFDTAHNAILEQPNYAAFAAALRESDCQRCPLAHSRSRIVIDRGNPAAKVLLISERPGDHEDREGRVFVGRSGELLDKIFAAIDMDTNRDTLIINVVKCKPETDRAPTTAEVEACRPYLEKQIALMQPRAILLIGLVALKYVTTISGEFSMESEAGKFFSIPEFPGTPCMVLYHPAFLLRDPRKKGVMWAHVKQLREYLQKEGIPPFPANPAPVF